MKFVQKWSYACANHFASVMNETHQKRAVYYYGLYIVIGTLIKGVILVASALLLGTLLPSLLIVFIFGTMRMLAGGYHMDTYGKCLFVSLVLYITLGLITQYTYQYWNYVHIKILIAATFISGLYVLVRYAPKDTPNKPITGPQQIRKYKILSLIYLLVWLIVSIMLAIFELNMYVIALSFGILLELFAITPTGHRFFDKINVALCNIL
mgnify:FL=1